MKASVIVMDTLDDRREVLTILLRGLRPAERVDFLDFAIGKARALHPQALARAKADRVKMQPLVDAAIRGDRVADLLLANEVFADLAYLSHQWGVDYRSLVTDLERWARGPRHV